MSKIKHIILDVVSMWIFLFMGILLAIFVTPLAWIFDIFFAIDFWKRTSIWVLFWIDSRKEDTQTVITKGYVFRGRYRIYELDITKKIYYSVIQFNDPRLKGEYIDLSDERHRQGDTLEVVFYRRSRVIKHITKLED